MVSSCVIIGVLVVIAPGGGTMTGTLVGSMVETLLGNTLFWVVSGCMVLNSCANLSIACNWISLIVKGVCVPGLLFTCISCLAALVACSVADNTGMMRCCGKDSTTYECIYPLVLVV